MGQYHLTVNLDKREFLNPHSLGNGLKLREQCGAEIGVAAALIALLAASNGRGGGDFMQEGFEDVIGRWKGDRIAIVGDYATDADLAKRHRAGSIYRRCDTGGFTDISDRVAAFLESEFGGKFLGDGWRYFCKDGDPIPEYLRIKA